jgi:hypothetical protein
VIIFHRSTLTYAFGYTGSGEDFGNEKYEIS